MEAKIDPRTGKISLPSMKSLKLSKRETHKIARIQSESDGRKRYSVYLNRQTMYPEFCTCMNFIIVRRKLRIGNPERLCKHMRLVAA